MRVSKGFMRILLDCFVSFLPTIYEAETETYGNKDFQYRHYICFSTDGNNTPLVALEVWDPHAICTDYPTITFYAEYDSDIFWWLED